MQNYVNTNNNKVWLKYHNTNLFNSPDPSDMFSESNKCFTLHPGNRILEKLWQYAECIVLT